MLLLQLFLLIMSYFLSVFALAFDLVNFDEALVCQVLAEVDVAAVVLNIRLVLFIKFAIVAGAFIEVARLSDQHSAEVVTDELLPPIQ